MINQIAAGEIIERPASVVRELLDNSLDAGASDILISVSGGGQQTLRVVDDGCGMESDDARLAFERHATSKLSSAGDLQRIMTFGFRGEALASIAAVSKVRLRTRTPDAATGIELRLDGGECLGVHEVSAAVGTEIEVSQLFFNTPARRKFLKTQRTEELKIKDWVVFSSLAKPQVRYRLTADGKEVLNLARRESFEERAASIFKGPSIAFREIFGPLTVTGVLLHPSQSQGGPQDLVLLANGRVVQDRLLVRAVKDGFSGALKDREFPVGTVLVELPPGEVDVNVSPQKSEVRFSQPQAVFVAVRTAVSRAVSGFRLPVASEAVTVRESPGISAFQGDAPQWATPESVPVQVGLPDCGQNFKYSDLVYLGQLFECYLLCEHQGRFVVLDMHAAHERINYNRLREGYANRAVPSQLVTGLSLSVGDTGVQRLKECLSELEGLGFQLDFSAEAVVLKAHPSLLSAEKSLGLLHEVAVEPLEVGSSSGFESRLDALCARTACHASVRSGKTISPPEVRALFAQLEEAEMSAACPHGRPAVVSFRRGDVERWFGRDR